MLLDGLRVVTTALNLPGPAACARLRDMGATVAKVEPPAGDPMEGFNPAWYRNLHLGMTIGRLDLKSEAGRHAMAKLLEGADVLVTAIADAAAALAQPLYEGLTRPGGVLGGGTPGYNLYAAREGWIALAALEPHFEKKLADKFALGKLTIEGLRVLFATHDAEYWEEWGRRNDIPIVAIRESTEG